jgi:hypothetical protein
MVMQDEHEIYPGSGRVLHNILRPAALWIVLMRNEMI